MQTFTTTRDEENKAAIKEILDGGGLSHRRAAAIRAKLAEAKKDGAGRTLSSFGERMRSRSKCETGECANAACREARRHGSKFCSACSEGHRAATAAA